MLLLLLALLCSIILSRVTSEGAHASNAKCAVKAAVVTGDQPPSVEVKFVDGTVRQYKSRVLAEAEVMHDVAGVQQALDKKYIKK